MNKKELRQFEKDLHTLLVKHGLVFPTTSEEIDIFEKSFPVKPLPPNLKDAMSILKKNKDKLKGIGSKSIAVLWAEREERETQLMIESTKGMIKKAKSKKS